MLGIYLKCKKIPNNSDVSQVNIHCGNDPESFFLKRLSSLVVSTYIYDRYKPSIETHGDQNMRSILKINIELTFKEKINRHKNRVFSESTFNCNYCHRTCLSQIDLISHQKAAGSPFHHKHLRSRSIAKKKNTNFFVNVFDLLLSYQCIFSVTFHIFYHLVRSSNILVLSNRLVL